MQLKRSTEGSKYIPCPNDSFVAGKKDIYAMIPKYPSIFSTSSQADMINNAMCDGGCYFDQNVFEIFVWELN